MSTSNPVLFRELPWDNKRGTNGMYLFMLTEAFLFIVLFFSYFFLGSQARQWPLDEPPKLMLATIMLVLLTASSAVLYIGEQLGKRGNERAARALTLTTIGMGCAFLVLQTFEYLEHLKKLTPFTDAYGSIFYTITSFHAAHLILGLCMLVYVTMLPKLEHTDRSPYRSLHNAGVYWHFVDAVWVFIVCLMYYLPHLQS